jgi:hypothetical protein
MIGELDRSSGEPLWSYQHTSGARPPLIHHHQALTGTESGELLVFDLSDEEAHDMPDDSETYLSTMVVRASNGKEEIHLCVGAEDRDSLVGDTVAAFVDATSKHRGRPEFGGHIKVVILGSTTDAAKTALPELRTRLNALAAKSDVRVSFTEQKGGW